MVKESSLRYKIPLFIYSKFKARLGNRISLRTKEDFEHYKDQYWSILYARKKFIYKSGTTGIAETVRRCYLELLNREPEEEGLDYFIKLFEKNELDENKLIDSIKSSNEFLAKNTPSAIIRRCYLELLNREPEEEAINHYVDLFEQNKMDEEKLIDSIKNGKEFLTKISGPVAIIRRCYLELLNREPEEEAINHYVDLFEQNKMDEEKLIDSLKSSKEYFIRVIYVELLHKEIKEGGYNFFLDLMEKEKLDKEKLIATIKNSEEYKKLEFKNKFTKNYQEQSVFNYSSF